jgi:predicted Rossmann fold nucleotide-binding protein DprA/Smf involved in DNA uptake
MANGTVYSEEVSVGETTTPFEQIEPDISTEIGDVATVTPQKDKEVQRYFTRTTEFGPSTGGAGLGMAETSNLNSNLNPNVGNIVEGGLTASMTSMPVAGVGVSGGPSAVDLQRVQTAVLNKCATVDVIARETGLTKDTVLKCLQILNTMGDVAKNNEMWCGPGAVKKLQAQFAKYCEVCSGQK